MDLIIPDWTAPANVGSLSTTRSGGFSKAPYDGDDGSGGLNLGLHVGDEREVVLRNRSALRSCLPAEPAWLSQVHGTTVVDAALVTDMPQADASYTTQKGVVCAIQTADCLPVLFADAAGSVVGAAHAGWRGLANGVLERTLDAMRNAGAGEISAWLGPAIGPRNFEVGQDVLDAFVHVNQAARNAFQPVEQQDGKYLADIYQLSRLILEGSGVRRISGGGLCTVADKHRFYSYRRDGVTGRMASLIWIK